MSGCRDRRMIRRSAQATPARLHAAAPRGSALERPAGPRLSDRTWLVAVQHGWGAIQITSARFWPMRSMLSPWSDPRRPGHDIRARRVPLFHHADHADDCVRSYEARQSGSCGRSRASSSGPSRPFVSRSSVSGMVLEAAKAFTAEKVDHATTRGTTRRSPPRPVRPDYHAPLAPPSVPAWRRRPARTSMADDTCIDAVNRSGPRNPLVTSCSAPKMPGAKAKTS